MVAVLPGHPNGPCDREQRCEGPVVRRETGSGVEQGGNHRDDADREHPHGGEARSEELHPGSDDQEAAGREDLEEVAIEYLATKDPRGAVEKDAFIAEPEDVAKDGGADRARDQRDGVEQRIAEEGRTRSGFEAGTSAHEVSMQGRSHRRFPFPTQSTFALVECEAFLGGGVGATALHLGEVGRLSRNHPPSSPEVGGDERAGRGRALEAPESEGRTIHRRRGAGDPGRHHLADGRC